MSFMPFDPQCYSRLFEKFQYLFEQELINEICQFGQLRKFNPEEILIDIGDSIPMMPFVLKGSIRILTEDKDENELLLYYLELGDTCAVTLNCCTQATKSTIRAITETETDILFIPIEKMDEWMIHYKSWRVYVLESYNSRLNEMLQAIDNVVFNSMEDRIKKYIRDKAWVLKTQTLNISHAAIANDLHSSRVVVSRIMKKLENQGFLKQKRGSVYLKEL